MAGNPNKSEIEAEVSQFCGEDLLFFFGLHLSLRAKPVILAEDGTNLWRRPFFWSSPEYEVNFHQIAAALRMRRVTAAKASPKQQFTV